MIRTLRLKYALLKNRLARRKGPAFRDQCAKIIMHTCSLQLERSEARELAPTRGASGPILLSGGAITTLAYRVFDSEADQVDPTIKTEPWRAFAQVAMRLTLEQDPQFEVLIDGKEIEPRAVHKAPGLELISHLSNYFPLLPKPHTGPTIIPAGGAA